MITQTELDVITAQMGKTPHGVQRVAARCSASSIPGAGGGSGHPGVIVTYPLTKDSDPFPTLYWLTCPVLRASISRLEMNGAITEIERAVNDDETLLARVREDHRRYVADRFNELSDADRSLIEQSQMIELFNERGIGGVADWSRVKCLHAHYAHHLADENAIGSMIEQRFGVRPCHGAPSHGT